MMKIVSSVVPLLLHVMCINYDLIQGQRTPCRCAEVGISIYIYNCECWQLRSYQMARPASQRVVLVAECEFTFWTRNPMAMTRSCSS